MRGNLTRSLTHVDAHRVVSCTRVVIVCPDGTVKGPLEPKNGKATAFSPPAEARNGEIQDQILNDRRGLVPLVVLFAQRVYTDARAPV